MSSKTAKSKIIIHRGKFDLNSVENDILSMHKCLNNGFSVEIDVHHINNRYFLGHDIDCLKEVSLEEIDIENVFIHLKTPSSPLLRKADSFFIDRDPIVFTSKGRQWVNAGVAGYYNSSTIICSDELIGKPINTQTLLDALGCSSWVCTKSPHKITSLWPPSF